MKRVQNQRRKRLLSNPHFDAVFRGKLSSNSSSFLEISAVGENEKPIRKDERRKDLEVIE